MTGKQHFKKLEVLKQKKRFFESSWQDSYDNTFPYLGQNIATATSYNPIGSSKTKTAGIYDVTLKDSCRLLASALVSGLTPSNSLWFGNELYGAAPGSSGQKWLDKASEVVWKNIHNSNFDDNSFLMMLHYVLMGMPCLYIGQGDLEKGQLYDFQLWHIRNCYFASSVPGGPIDIVYRVDKMTAAEAVAFYNRRLDKLPEEIVKAATKKPDDEYEFCHAIYPRMNPKKSELPIASEHFSLKTKTLIRKSGYEEHPCVIPRWMPIPDSVYSLGPADDALPEHKTLNKVKELGLDNAEMAIAGTYLGLDDGSVNPKTVQIGPRRLIMVTSKDAISPLKSSADFKVEQFKVQEMQDQIRRIMMSDRLHPQETPQMTAYEFSVRVKWIRELLGPMYGRLQSEYLKPMVDRCFGIAYRAGVIGEVPEEIKAKLSKVSFRSPMAKGQKLEDIAAMDRFEDRLYATAQADPTILDVYDREAAAKKRAELEGVPLELLNDEKTMKKIRKDREEKIKAAQEAEQKTAMQQNAIKGASGNARKTA